MQMSFVSMFLRAVVFFLLGVGVAYTAALVTTANVCPINSPGCPETADDLVRVIFGVLAIFGTATLGVLYLVLFIRKTNFTKEMGLAIQYVSVVLGLMSLIGVTSLVSSVAKIRSLVIQSGLSLDITENLANFAGTACSNRGAGFEIDGASVARACDLITAINQFLNGALREQVWHRVQSDYKDIALGRSEKDCEGQRDYALIIDKDNKYGKVYDLRCALGFIIPQIDSYFERKHRSEGLEDYEVRAAMDDSVSFWRNIMVLKIVYMHSLVYVGCLTLFRISAESLGKIEKDAMTYTLQDWLAWMRTWMAQLK
jgi:hypothetical protein